MRVTPTVPNRAIIQVTAVTLRRPEIRLHPIPRCGKVRRLVDMAQNCRRAVVLGNLVVAFGILHYACNHHEFALKCVDRQSPAPVCAVEKFEQAVVHRCLADVEEHAHLLVSPTDA